MTKQHTYGDEGPGPQQDSHPNAGGVHTVVHGPLLLLLEKVEMMGSELVSE